MSRPCHADEGTLLAQWRAGDVAAGARLCRRYQAPLTRFFRVRTHLPADDLVQSTLLALITSSGFRGDSSVRTYVFEVARRVLYRALRRHLIDTTRSEPLHEDFAVRDPRSSDCAPDVQNALEAIDPALRELLELFYWNDLTTREIADRMRIPEGTVSSRLRKARQQLRSRLVQS